MMLRRTGALALPGRTSSRSTRPSTVCGFEKTTSVRMNALEPGAVTSVVTWPFVAVMVIEWAWPTLPMPLTVGISAESCRAIRVAPHSTSRLSNQVRGEGLRMGFILDEVRKTKRPARNGPRTGARKNTPKRPAAPPVAARPRRDLSCTAAGPACETDLRVASGAAAAAPGPLGAFGLLVLAALRPAVLADGVDLDRVRRAAVHDLAAHDHDAVA